MVVSWRFFPSSVHRSKNNASAWISRGPPFPEQNDIIAHPFCNASTSSQGSWQCPHSCLWKSCCILFSAPCRLRWHYSPRETTLQSPVSKVLGSILAWFYIKSKECNCQPIVQNGTGISATYTMQLMSFPFCDCYFSSAMGWAPYGGTNLI